MRPHPPDLVVWVRTETGMAATESLWYHRGSAGLQTPRACRASSW